MVSTLTRIFGTHNVALAEDVVQDAFCRALEVWKFRGVPDNPSAWLMTAAKNRALDLLRRERTARTYEPVLNALLKSEWTLATTVEELFSEEAIEDDQLRTMFSCCHPRLSEEAQIALILKILCGFSVHEIANAFVSGYAAVEKRITRAKNLFAESEQLFDVSTAEDFIERLPSVHRALYLLFNEGYHGASPESAVRRELCREAIRLTALLLRHPQGATPKTYALAALMCLHAARLPGRLDATGNLSLFLEQDRLRWDQTLIADGLKLMELSATGSELSEYHLEAAIASVHATAARTQETDWERIVSLYDGLLTLRPSPVVALNRAIAIGQRHGPQAGLEAIQAIGACERLAAYPFYHAALGEMELRCGRAEVAREHLQKAHKLARNAMERQFFEQRIAAST